MSDKDVANEAEIIAFGKVLKIENTRENDDIFSLITFEIIYLFKNTSKRKTKNIKLRVENVLFDGIIKFRPHEAFYELGENVILMCKKTKRDNYRTVGLGRGKYNVNVNDNGSIDVSSQENNDILFINKKLFKIQNDKQKLLKEFLKNINYIEKADNIKNVIKKNIRESKNGKKYIKEY
jgi:hypothetical protein